MIASPAEMRRIHNMMKTPEWKAQMKDGNSWSFSEERSTIESKANFGMKEE